MKLESKIREKIVAIKGNPQTSFIFIAKNKNGINVPLLAEYQSEDNISVSAILKRNQSQENYKKIDTLSIKSFINNNIIQSIHGTNPIAKSFKRLVDKNLSQQDELEIVKNIKTGVNLLDSESAVQELLVAKIKESADLKAEKLLDLSNKTLENSFMIIYNNEGQQIYLHAERNEDEITLTSPMLNKNKEMDMTLSISELIASDKVLAVHGTNDLSKKLKELHGKKQFRMQEADLVEYSGEIIEEIKATADPDIMKVLEEKSKVSKKSTRKNK
jgi:hypothetical protein